MSVRKCRCYAGLRVGLAVKKVGFAVKKVVLAVKKVGFAVKKILNYRNIIL